MKIGVFCSANENIAAEFFDCARQLGSWIAANAHSLVYGGTRLGLMGAVANAVHDGGGTVIGILPMELSRRGIAADCNDVVVPCDNLSDRKELMMAQADVFVALPGGIGTLDEAFTVAAAATAGYHTKKVILLNTGGFWNKLTELLDSLQQSGFIRDSWHNHFIVCDSAESAEKEISKLQ